MPRLAALLLLLVAAVTTVACNASPTGGYVCGEAPGSCYIEYCATQVETFRYEDCCDSTTCNCNPRTRRWEIWACDPPAPPDAGVTDATFDATPSTDGWTVPDAALADATRP
jgi:hypothetical protein